MAEVYQNVDKCKVCGNHYVKVNKSHTKTHGITWDEYLAYGDIVLKDGGKAIKSIWDSVNVESIEYKTRYRKMRHNLIRIQDRESVDLRQGKYCFGCLDKIDELAVYIILTSEREIRYKQAEVMKKPYHLNCAAAKAEIYHAVGLVMNPIENS